VAAARTRLWLEWRNRLPRRWWRAAFTRDARVAGATPCSARASANPLYGRALARV